MVLCRLLDHLLSLKGHGGFAGVVAHVKVRVIVELV